ncbi:MAG: PaaI family thioesterase [Castellaniella sp.]
MNATSPNQNATDESGWREHQLPGLMGELGPLLSKKTENGWLYGLRAGKSHLNAAGIVHGGTVSTLLDHAFSAVCWHACDKHPCLTVQLNVNFLAPALEGDLLVVHTRITRKTRSLLFVDGSLCARGKTIATAQAIVKPV